MTRSPTGHAPETIVAIARQRRSARERHDWAAADDLRREIESAGWAVVDEGLDFELRAARPPDVVEQGRTRYGASASVPSRLEEPSTTAASVILVATDWPADLARAVAGLGAAGPELQVIVVADAPSDAQAAALEELEVSGTGTADVAPEQVWTSARLGEAAALNSGIRRAIGTIVILLDLSIEPVGDIVAPLAAALDDPGVGVAGGFGVVSDDLRHFRPAPPGEVDAIEARCLAFRRADYVARGPLDEKFRLGRNLELWWSLILRDEGSDRESRRAIALSLPLIRHDARDPLGLSPAERDRLARRDFYRFIDRFGARRDLLAADRHEESAPSQAPQVGPG